jgi:hypothetical protein
MSEEIRRVESTSLSLTQLPNGDLWRGAANINVAPTADEEDTGKEPLSALDNAMASIVKSSKGPELTCIWCGKQIDKKKYADMAEHIKISHSAALTPITDTAALAKLLPQVGTAT